LQCLCDVQSKIKNHKSNIPENAGGGEGYMDRSYPNYLRIWSDWPALVQEDDAAAPAWRGLRGPHNPSEFAERLYAGETLNPTQPATDETPEPYTLQWFLNIEDQRHSRHGRWIPKVLEFAKHQGETLLGMGNGLGTDWIQYARHGASVVVCSAAAGQLALIRRNFELRGLSGRFLHAAPDALPLDTASIDVACLSSVLPDENNARVVAEVYRVLKPGGKVLAVAPAKYDVDFWYRLCFPLHAWLWRGNLAAEPDVPRFSARRLKRLFAPFVEHRVSKRHLRRSEVPHLWRWLPTAVLQRLLGRVLVLKAFKPLSAAMAVHLAA
jgi:SAM-dependent methyltransferase